METETASVRIHNIYSRVVDRNTRNALVYELELLDC